jgi:ABC-type sugar transport system permease subunit
MHSLVWALAAVPIQIALVGCAGCLLRWTGEASGPRLILTHASWVISVSVGLALIWQTTTRPTDRSVFGAAR